MAAIWKKEVSWKKTTIAESLHNAVDGLAPLYSPAFSGEPTSPTPSSGNISGRIATTEYTRNVLDDTFYVSEYYMEPRNVPASDQGVASDFYYVSFKPKVFSISNGGYITKLRFHTRTTATTAQLPSEPVKLAITDSTGNNILDVSDVQSGMSTADNDVGFNFSGKVPLNENDTYRIQFRNSDDTYPAQHVGLQLFIKNPNADYFLVGRNGTTTWRPFMEVFAENIPFISKGEGYSYTNTGAITKYIGATVNGEIVGGPTITNSRFNNNSETAYTLHKIKDVNTVNNVTTTTVYTFTSDKTDTTGVARFGDLPTTTAPTSSATEGQFADAKLTYDALAACADDKLDSTVAAPSFSTLSTYSVNEYVTKSGQLYQATSAVTAAGDWNSAQWKIVDMTTPDATLDVTSQGALRVVSSDGTTLWHQGWTLKTISSTVLSNEASNLYEFAESYSDVAEFNTVSGYSANDRVAYDGKVYKFNTAHSAGDWIGTDVDLDLEVQEFALPSIPTGRMGDLILDLDNSANAYAVGVDITQYKNNTINLFLMAFDDIDDLLTIAGGAHVELRFTLTSFNNSNNKVTWKIVREDMVDDAASS